MKCRWCGKPNRTPSEWEQQNLKGEWHRLCVRCANVRLRNPYCGLLTEMTKVMRKVGTEGVE